MAEELEPHAGRVQEHVQQALRLGFPISCASCEHLHRAWDSSADDCGFSQTCGGPLFGRSYPDYKGPLTAQAFEKICLICGKSVIDFHVVAGERRFGLCFDHRDALDKVVDLRVRKPMIVPAPGRLT